MMAGHRDDRGYCAGLQHQGAPGDAHACHVRGQAAGDPVHQRVQCAHCQHQRANQKQEVHPGGKTYVARVNSAADTSGYWNDSTDPLPTAAIPANPSRKVTGMASAVAPHRLRVSDFWLSTVYTRCHIPG